MKIKTIHLTAIAFLLFTSYGCQRESLSEPYETPNATTLNKGVSRSASIPYASITKVNGLLSFENMESFKATFELLESSVLEYDDQFLLANQGLTAEELEQKELEIGYDEYTPLLEFCAAFNFNSLFLKQADAEREWLMQEVLDLETDPDNHFVEDEALQAMVNEQSEVIISQSIYKMFDFGYIIITDGDFQTLLQIRENPENLDYQNVDIVGDRSRFLSCRSSKTNREIEIDGDYKIKWKISHRTPITGRRVKAVTKNYKKRNLFGWKKVRHYTKCMAYGFVSDVPGDCVNPFDFNPTLEFSEQPNKKRWYHKMEVETKTRPFWVKGYHLGVAGISFTSTLVW